MTFKETRNYLRNLSRKSLEKQQQKNRDQLSKKLLCSFQKKSVGLYNNDSEELYGGF